MQTAFSAPEMARSLMHRYALRTGLAESAGPLRRYLWTDAFAVCNFLELYRHDGDPAHLRTALRLVGLVHEVLGKHRPDDSRKGWISGLDEAMAQRHPTAGGLRIGKPRNERPPDQAFDQDLEWDRDGQYFHYLTRWMHALARVGAVTGEPRYHRQAVELLLIAHRKFVYRPSPDHRPRMFWKMSIDLSRPQVPSMGHHDPLDGLLTALELRTATAGPLHDAHNRAIHDLSMMCTDGRWATSDPLGLGGLLADAYRCLQLLVTGRLEDPTLLTDILGAALAGLGHDGAIRSVRQPASRRLAFRELGLAIGLEAIPRMRRLLAVVDPEICRDCGILLAELNRFRSAGSDIAGFWSQPDNRHGATFKDHLDINEVMLATALLPETYLSA